MSHCDSLCTAPYTAALVAHTDIAAFADERVNLKRDDVTDYREQVRRLRDKLERYAADHPDYGIFKTLLSGSLAKGTALKTLNDIDLALYVRATKAPKSEPDLLNWLALRLREAYPQMKAEQITPNAHSVCIRYAVSGLSVDVVPVLSEGDPDDRGYLFASDGSKPVLTSIPLHLAFTRKRKDAQPTHFAQVVRAGPAYLIRTSSHTTGMVIKVKATPPDREKKSAMRPTYRLTWGCLTAGSWSDVSSALMFTGA